MLKKGLYVPYDLNKMVESTKLAGMYQLEKGQNFYILVTLTIFLRS